MNKAQKKRLEDDGWRFGTAQEFLELSDAEAELIEIRLALSKKLPDGVSATRSPSGL